MKIKMGLKLRSGCAAPVDEEIIVDAENFSDAQWKAREELISRYNFPSYGKITKAKRHGR